MTEITETESMRARAALLNWLDGYMRGVTSMNGMVEGHQRVSGVAFFIKAASNDIDLALAMHHSEICTSLSKDFPDLDVAEFQFEPAETHSEWLRWLHIELEQRLLPSPVTLHRERDRALVDTRYHVAWIVMDMMLNIVGHPGPPLIYSAKFARGDQYDGCAYVIPLVDCHLVLKFQTQAQHARQGAAAS